MLSQHHTTTLPRRIRTLPIRLFSWSAAASLGMLATLSFDAPALAHHFRYRDIVGYSSPLSTTVNRDALNQLRDRDEDAYERLYQHFLSRENNAERNISNYNEIVPTCIPEDIIGSEYDEGLVNLGQGVTQSYTFHAIGIIRTVPHSVYLPSLGVIFSYKTTYKRLCHIEENKPPTTTGSIPDQTFLSVGGTLSDQCNAEKDTRFSTDLSSLFEDPDGDDLTYEVTGERSWINASISGSTLSVNALEEAATGDSTTITVTASDGKDDGDASLSFNVNIVAEKTPKPILSKKAISLTLKEAPPDQLAQDSYSVTLSCQYRFPVTVEISDTAGSLEVGPTALTFNETNWNVPQTVRVRAVGTTSGEFTLPHAAVTTTSEGKTVRESDDLRITVTYEEIEDEMDEMDEMEDDTEDDTEDEMDDDTQDEMEDPLEELNDILEDILKEDGSREEKQRKIEEAVNDWTEEQRKEIGTELGKEFAKEAAEEILETVVINKVLKPIKIAKAAKEILSEVIDAGVDFIQDQLRPSDSSNEQSNSSNEQINSLAENLYIHHEALQNGAISLDQAFSGLDLSVPFSLAQTDSKDQGSSPRFNALSNADIDFSQFSDSSDPDLSIDGTTINYGIGLTLIPNPEVPLIAGLQFGYTRSNSDFEYLEAIEGTYDLEMFNVSPFIAWDASDSLTFWTTLDYGRPNTETTINSIVGLDFDSTEEESYSSSGDFFSFAGGANYRVWQSDLSALSIGLSGSTTSFLDNDSKEGSISAQFSHNFPFNTGQLKTSADLALTLSDSGPSATELSSQLNWLPSQGRLSGSTNARVLLFGGDRSEWGIGGSVVLLPGERGEGLSLALQPSFGQTNSSLSHLHLDPFSFTDPNELALSSSPLTARFNAELAYGFPTANHALLTPYIDASLAHSSNTYTTGLRYQLDSGLDLDLSASHRQRSSGNNDNRFFLQLRSDL